MQQQANITAQLVHRGDVASLPPRVIPIFDGDPLQFAAFIQAFEHGIERKTTNAQDCLYYLEQYTRGQPRELVRSCHHMSAEQGFRKAKNLLKEHFGHEFKITAAYMEKALNWPAIKPDDINGLQAYALFLRGYCNVMVNLQYMDEINVSSNLKNIMMKLPYRLREKWRTTACELQERNGCRLKFIDMVDFIEHQVKILTDPLFGDIKDTQAPISHKAKVKSLPCSGWGRNSATVAVVNTVGDFQSKVHPSQHSFSSCCYACKENHVLERCREIHKMTHRQKIEFLKNHGTIEEKQVSNALVTLQTFAHIGAGEQDCFLSTVPVQVKSKLGDFTVTTYAFLDPGSTATFCTEGLMRRLKMTGMKKCILLRTMGHENVVNTSVLNGLEISGLSEDKFMDLPEVLTQKTIPVSKDNVLNPEDIRKWRYLDDVKIPKLDAEVELLIGTNAPKLLEPWEIINSEGQGPYAVKTLLGWVINGFVKEADDRRKIGFQSVTANRISVAKLEELLVAQYNHDFDEKSSEDDFKMSREDQRFMEIMDQSISTENGHYCIDLPFRNNDVIMPNNRCLAEQRLKSLKRKFSRNQEFQEEYITFLTDVINKGYAEAVPQEQLLRDDGKVWYIPHHGVYHPKKKTIRVVFDCSAVFKGVSLNSQLLQGPNLTNTLFGVLTRFRQEHVTLMADIQAMFHQVKVSQKNVDFLRFLWWPNGDTTQSLKEYRMKVHLFGAISSPTCSNFALRKLAEDYKDCFPNKVLNSILHNFYVDDCLISVPTEVEALQMVKDLTAVCSKGGFQLSKWISNSRKVLASIPEERLSKSTKDPHPG